MNTRLEIIDATPKAFRVRFPTGHDCWLPKAAAEYLAGLVAEIDAWNHLVVEHHACGALKLRTEAAEAELAALRELVRKARIALLDTSLLRDDAIDEALVLLEPEGVGDGR